MSNWGISLLLGSGRIDRFFGKVTGSETTSIILNSFASVVHDGTPPNL